MVLMMFLALALVLAACNGDGDAPADEPTPGTGAPPPSQPPDSPISPLSPLSPLAHGEQGAVLLVIAQNDFNDTEYVQPRAVLEAAGYTVFVASLSTEAAIGMQGLEVQPDIALAQVNAADYEAILFIGGSGANVYWGDAEAHRVAQEAANQAKVLGAICMAPVTLARAGVLEGVEATVFNPTNLCSELEANGATCTGATVQRDGRIVTGNGPEASLEFVDIVIQVLQEP
jgi:protease I